MNMPTAEEIFGPDNSQPVPESSISMEMADRECVRLGVEDVYDEPPDEPPPYSGFYELLKQLHDTQTEKEVQCTHRGGVMTTMASIPTQKKFSHVRSHAKGDVSIL